LNYLIIILFASKVLDELFRRITQKSSHPVNDAHGLALLGILKPDALVNVLYGQVQRDDLVVNLKKTI
jgi:hypothetical protein